MHILAIIERPEGTPERRAIRRWFRSPGGAVAQEKERHAQSVVPAEYRGNSPVDSLEPGITVRTEAESLEALISLVRPTLMLGKIDMVWIVEDQPGKPSFSLDRAYHYRPPGEKARWVLLRFEDQDAPALLERILRMGLFVHNSIGAGFYGSFERGAVP